MHSEIIIELINNTLLLMTLIIIYEISYFFPKNWTKLTPILNGCFIGLIGIAIMSMPFRFVTGVVFDTRSILICVSAMTFGYVPTIVAVCITVAYRIYMGGAGALMGVLVISTSAIIGLLWRKYLINKKQKYRWLNLYLFGFVVHVVMLACTMALPAPTGRNVLSEIGYPVMLVYPVGTVLLSLLLIKQKERNESLINLKEAEERYSSLFLNSHAVMLIIELDTGLIIDANPAAVSFYGWDLDTIRTMNISDINVLNEQEIHNEMQKANDEKRNYLLFKHLTASGKVIDVEVYSGPMIMNRKKLVYSIIHDITDRIASDKALKESEKRFRQLVIGAPEGIFIQSERKFIFLNKAALKLFGADSYTQLIGRPVLEMIHPNLHPIIEQRMNMLEENNSVPLNEDIYIKLDGTNVPVEVAAIPVTINEKHGAIIFARDITERKILEKSKIEMEAQLRQQQKLEAIGVLAGGVAHEINNPINGIMNYAQLILDEIDPDSAEGTYAKEILQETERISTIVKNLLQFSRQDKQSHSYASIYDIVKKTVSLINTIIKKDQINLIIELDENLPDIKCRSQQIQQVLMNFLTNARDALNEKYEHFDEDKIIFLRCRQYEIDQLKWVQITIEDHGNGIPKDLHEKIFEPFFSTKPKDIGTGLGLSISFGIVKDHQGKITFDTKEGQYTKFMIDLPIDNHWIL